MSKNSDSFQVVAVDPSNSEAARAATVILDHYQVDVSAEVQKEMSRQLLYGEEPSEGMPDVRPRYLRYEDAQ